MRGAKIRLTAQLIILRGPGKEHSMMIRRLWAFSGFLVAAFLAGLIPSSLASAGPATYTFGDDTGDWGYPTPHRRYARGPGYVRMSYLFDTLTWKNEAGKVIPALAKKWEYLDVENSYVFDLDPTVRWHDGKAFTADDVVFTVEYNKKHPTPWVNSRVLTRAECIGPQTVKIFLKERDASFLTDIAGTLAILPKHIWKNVGEHRKFEGNKAMVGTGPFRLLDYNKVQGSYLYEANRSYYGGRLIVDRVKFIKVGAEMIAAALKQGYIDAGPIPPDLVNSTKQAGFQVIQAPYGWNLKLVMNHTQPPLNDKSFRQAMAHAIDRQGLVEITQRGHAVAGNPGFVPPDSPWFYPRVKQYEWKPDRAKALLEGLGYSIQKGKLYKNGSPLKLELLSQPRFKDVGIYLKNQLERLGIQIELRSLEPKTLDSRVLNWQFQLAISGHGGLYEPSFLTRRILGNDFNSVRYRKNEELGTALQAQLKEMDPQRRKKIVFRIQELYAEDVPNLTLYYPKWYYAHNGRIRIYYIRNGISIGIPLPLSKMVFVEKKG